MAIHYSKYFHITHKDLVSKGVYNGYIDKDSQLHIDPLLLKGCKIPEFTNAYEEFLQYFRGFVSLTRAAICNNISDRFFRQMMKRFVFSEIPNTGLGYSTRNTHGRGISGALSIQLAQSAYEIIKAGMVDPEIFGLMPLIEDNIGADRISDMTIAILQKNVLQFTERISNELGIVTKEYEYNGVAYQVPYYRSKPVHFVPMALLADLPIAHDYDDIDAVCNYNTKLKKRVADIIGIAWIQYKDYKKSDWKKILLNNRKCYDVVIDSYKRLNGLSYDFNMDNKEQYIDVYLAEFLNQFPFSVEATDETPIEEEVYNLTMSICKQFKHLVEDKRMSEMFHRKGRKPDESDWQMLLYSVADTYKESNNLDISITREDNPGVGELDFHITRGSKANTVIEIKRTCNENLIHGYRTQLAAYMRAERATSGIFMVIVEDDSIDTIKQKITEVQIDMRTKGEYIPEVIYVHGKRQPSASKTDYINPNI